VWATSDASATSGSWFSVTLRNRADDSVAPGATRIDLGRRIGLLERAQDGTLRLTAAVSQTAGPQSLTVRSYGRTADELVALFRSIAVDHDRPSQVDDRPQYLDPSQLDGFEQLAARSTDQDLIDTYLAGTPTSSTYYTNGAGDSYISIGAAPRDSSLEPLGRLAVGPVRIFPDSTSVPSTFTGDDLVLGVSPSGEKSEIVARWHAGGHTIVVRATIPLGDLLQLLPTLRAASDGEWGAVERRVDRTSSTPGARGPAGDGAQFASSTFGDGTSWSASIQLPDWLVISADGATLVSSMSTPDDSGPIQVWSLGTQTVVAVVAPPELGAFSLSVSSQGRQLGHQQMIDVASIDASSSFAGNVAVFAFDETGPFDVDVIDFYRNVVAHFSSPVVST
jgi:hypothetical protein